MTHRKVLRSPRATAGVLFSAGIVVLAMGALVASRHQRRHDRDDITARLGRLQALPPAADAGANLRCSAVGASLSGDRHHPSAALASWQTIGGCGAGASTGTGGGAKWIGRYVQGGLFNLECQANYVDTPYGYNFIGNSLVTHELTSRWSVGVSVPYLYKYMRDPYAVGVDLANKGPGDVTLMLTHKFGATRNWIATAGIGLPTGVYKTRYRMELLPQDRQLGLGMPTAQLTLDHVTDHLWGVTVIGGTASWRGAENDEGSSRAPSVGGYAYAGYLLGPFVPAAGVSLTGFLGNDRDRLQEQVQAAAIASANVSLEWSNDSMAVLLSGSMPYELAVSNSIVAPYNRFGSWIATLGMAFALF